MKFRFCGDLDAPDWLLADIALLSKIVRNCSGFAVFSDMIFGMAV